MQEKIDKRITSYQAEPKIDFDYVMTAEDVKDVIGVNPSHEATMQVLANDMFKSYRAHSLTGNFYEDYTKVILMLR